MAGGTTPPCPPDQTGGGPVRLRAVEPGDVGVALAETLAGGPPVAPLPADPAERGRTLAMVRLDEPVVEPDAAVVVATSGSTGRPKGVVLTRAALIASAAASHDRLGGPGDWVLALPPHYVAGLMVWARALVAGSAVTTVGSDLSGLTALPPVVSGRRYLSLVPTQLTRALTDERLAEALAGFDAVLLGGAALGGGLRSRAEALGIRVVTTYGMSETAGGCAYDGRPLTGVTVEVDAEDGRITLGGPTLFSGYRLRPDLTAAGLVDGRLPTQDRGRWRDGRLEVLGRVDDVVITGGLNVDLAEVEQRARAWPRLAGDELAVLGLGDPEWGTKIIAVTESGGSLAELRDFLLPVLPAYAAPRELVRVDPLPRLSSGKIDRRTLRSLLHEGTA